MISLLALNIRLFLFHLNIFYSKITFFLLHIPPVDFWRVSFPESVVGADADELPSIGLEVDVQTHDDDLEEGS